MPSVNPEEDKEEEELIRVVPHTNEPGFSLQVSNSKPWKYISSDPHLAILTSEIPLCTMSIFQ